MLAFSDEESTDLQAIGFGVYLFSPLEKVVLSVVFVLVQAQFYLSCLAYLQLLLLNFAVHFSVSLNILQNAELRPEYFFICAITFVCVLLEWLNIVLYCLNSTPASPKHFFNFLRTFLTASLILQFTCDPTCLMFTRPIFYPRGNWNVFDMVCSCPVLAFADVRLLEYFWLNVISSKLEIRSVRKKSRAVHSYWTVSLLFGLLGWALFLACILHCRLIESNFLGWNSDLRRFFLKEMFKN